MESPQGKGHPFKTQSLSQNEVFMLKTRKMSYLVRASIYQEVTRCQEIQQAHHLYCLFNPQDNPTSQELPYFAMYNAHFFAQIFEGKIRIHIIHVQYLIYLVPVLAFCNFLLHKISCTICSKINAKIPLYKYKGIKNIKNKYLNINKLKLN